MGSNGNSGSEKCHWQYQSQDQGLTIRENSQSSPILRFDELKDMLKLAGGATNASRLAIGGGISESGSRFSGVLLASHKFLRRPEPVGGAHIVVRVQAVRSASTRLGEVGAVAVVVSLTLRSAGHVDESGAKAEGHCYAGVGLDVRPVDGGTNITAGTLEGLQIDGGSSPHECCEDWELGDQAGEMHYVG